MSCAPTQHHNKCARSTQPIPHPLENGWDMEVLFSLQGLHSLDNLIDKDAVAWPSLTCSYGTERGVTTGSTALHRGNGQQARQQEFLSMYME